MRLVMLTQKVDRYDDLLGFVAPLLAHLAQECRRIDVCCLQEGRHDLPRNVHVHPLGKDWTPKKSKWGLRLARLAAGFVAEGDVDVWFGHMNPEFTLALAPFAKASGRPLVMWYAHRAVSLRLRAALAVCDAAATSVPAGLRLKSRKVHVIGQCIDTDAFVPHSEGPTDPPTILAVGRISPIKDTRTLLGAFHRLVEEHGDRDARLRIIGEAALPADRGYEAECREFVRKHGLGGRVDFAGKVAHSSLPAIVAASAVGVNLAPTGAVDKAALESMACGVPTVVCNETFSQFFSAEDPRRLLFRAGDAADLAVRLRDVLSLPPATRASMSRRLRGMVIREHSVEHMTRGLMRIFGAVRTGG
ncbi:MAG: glycosyltransferase [Planctomycetes bacterium]|nr:glycosyltransferase [Planctomycetota bacterium]